MNTYVSIPVPDHILDDDAMPVRALFLKTRAALKPSVMVDLLRRGGLVGVFKNSTSMRHFFLQCCVALVLSGILSVTALAAPSYQIGVYYYPGWSPNIKGPNTPDTWNDIKPYADEREPLLGWYHDGKRSTLDRQLAWMADHGIAFTIFDWYWEKGKPATETSVRAYLESPERKRVRYALLWANHTNEPNSLKEWDALSDFWISQHLKNPEYIQIDGKPALFVFSPEVLDQQARLIGVPVAKLLDRTRSKARAAGLKGVYFVLCVPAIEHWVKGFAPAAGFDALSAYNYHFGVEGDAAKQTSPSETFEELDDGYRKQWRWILANSQLPYFPAMTSGWDNRPWGGSKNPRHDNSVSTPQTFEAHLRAAKAAMDAHPEKTKRIGVVCCWNEFGEGSYIEPTKKHGHQYLERVRQVFGKPPP
jgi:hypothetical protein